VDIDMPPLGDHARAIIDRMDPGNWYGLADLRAFLPDVTVERLREIMHELWIARQVERVGYSGWRRLPSPPPHRSGAVPRASPHVKPEELFDHASFADFFK
jgi:hypothetical protein